VRGGSGENVRNHKSGLYSLSVMAIASEMDKLCSWWVDNKIWDV